MEAEQLIPADSEPRTLTRLVAFGVIGLSLATLSPGNVQAVECGDALSVVAPYEHPEEIAVLTPEAITDPIELQTYLTHIEDRYGIPVTFDHPPTPETAVIDAGSLEGSVRAMEEIGEAVTTKLELSGFTLVDSIESDDGNNPAGLYYINANTITLAAGSQYQTRRVALHELGHALDYRLVCPSTNAIDSVMSQQDAPAETPLEKQLFLPTEYRRFASEYGATSVAEDRSTQLEYLFYERGIIQPQDPDYGSPFQEKQAEMLRRLEAITPGIKAYLEEKTKTLRNLSSELSQGIEIPFYSDEFASAEVILALAFKEGIPVEQLRNTTVTITPLLNKPIQIQDPVVIRNKKGTISTFAWTPSTDGSVKIATFYNDPTIVSVDSSEQSYSHYGLIEATAPAGEGFFTGGLRIDGQWASQNETTDLPTSLQDPVAQLLDSWRLEVKQ